ncbi:TPA: transcriptional regulator, partial [Streptococcus agalactiae]
SPKVSTIVQPAYEEGEQVAQILINRIEGDDSVDNQQIVDCQMFWKESTF